MAVFASPDLIQLPRLSSQEASDLIGEMLTVARMRQASLPPAIERSLERLRAAHATLETALRSAFDDAASASSTGPLSSRGGPMSSRGGPMSSRGGPMSSRGGPLSVRGAPLSVRSPLAGQPPTAPRSAAIVPSNVRRRADRLLDSAWEATFDWLSGWCKLAEEANPHRSEARELFELIFADALAFGTLPYKIEFAQSRERLAAIELEGHEATFATLGGAVFLAHLRSVHAALQVIVRQDMEIDCHEQLAAAAGALRQYVIRVSSHADTEIYGSEDLSQALMAPLDRWHKLHPARPPEDAFGAVEETLF
jgi:hypothetical protein